MKEPQIVVLGANGQVGTEVTLLLSRMTGLSVIPIVRTHAGAHFLRWVGLEPRIGSITSGEQAGRLLDGATLVADFSLPPLGQGRRLQAAVIRAAISAAPHGIPYVYASTTMAFGMPSSSRDYRPRWLARTQYAALKRHSESVVHAAARSGKRSAFVLRLGQVHGALQRVSHGIRDLVKQGKPIVAPRGADGPSDTVFCSTIAAALVSIAGNPPDPATYTLVECPEWSHRQLLEHYAAQVGVPLDLRTPKRVDPSMAARLRRRVTDVAAALIAANKELLMAHLQVPADVESRTRAWNAKRRVAAELATGTAVGVNIFDDRQGGAPGQRLQIGANHLGDAQRAASVIESLLDEMGVFPSPDRRRSQPEQRKSGSQSFAMGKVLGDGSDGA
jgi:nucleoside-diphosphate-sugar epimerase